MRVVRVDDGAPYGVALGSVLVSLLEPAPGTARAFNRWYERDHFYAGCMTGESFFAGRRFVATHPLKAQRYPASSAAIEDTSLGSFLALYWMERGHHAEAEAWAVERVLWLGANGRMQPARKAIHASFYGYRFAALRDADGVPPEVALDHPFAGLVMVLSERPPDVERERRDAWLLESFLAERLPGSKAAMCLSLDPMQLPESSPAYTPPTPESARRHLELYFLDCDPREAWDPLFADLGRAQADAVVGRVGFAASFIPTVPGTDRYVDEL